jgi:hypothetical protein
MIEKREQPETADELLLRASMLLSLDPAYASPTLTGKRLRALRLSLIALIMALGEIQGPVRQ